MSAILKFSRNLSRISAPWLRVAAMVVSEMIDRLSPNIAPPRTAPSTTTRSRPEASATPSAIGTTAAIVPMDVPIASEISAASTNRPGRISPGGSAPMPSATTASTAPIALDTYANAPASRKIRHIIMMFGSPMPRSRISPAGRPRRRASRAPSASAGRIATGARSW